MVSADLFNDSDEYITFKVIAKGGGKYYEKYFTVAPHTRKSLHGYNMGTFPKGTYSVTVEIYAKGKKLASRTETLTFY